MQFVEEKKTGYPLPGNVDFEEYQGKIKKKEKDKKDDKKKVNNCYMYIVHEVYSNKRINVSCIDFVLMNACALACTLYINLHVCAL